jgi:pimeloyl-ACP methyl ester carboxylesterase
LNPPSPPTGENAHLRKPGRLVRVLSGALAILLILLSAGALFQVTATAIDARRYPIPGHLVDVGGYRLHLFCLGENSGGRPTVVFETGLGGFATSADWARVQPEVAKTTRSCAYDRAGLGWSDPGPGPRDARHIAAELHTLLQNSHTPGPYILVGWSFGGLYIREYADQYRADVTGMVLLEGSSPEQCAFSPAWQAQCASAVSNAATARILSRLGILRVIGLFQPATGLPEPQNGALFASFGAVKDWDAQNAELQASPVTYAQVLQAKLLGDIPIYVLTATEHGAAPELEQQWQAWQSGYTALSTNSRQKVVHGATHESLVFNSSDAQVTIAAVLKVVEAAHSNVRLAP